MTRPLIILGASGNALDVLDVVDAVNAVAPTWQVVGLLDDARTDAFAGAAILGRLNEARRFPAAWFVGDGALVGLGAVVLRDVEAGAVVVGNPARVLERAVSIGPREPGGDSLHCNSATHNAMK